MTTAAAVKRETPARDVCDGEGCASRRPLPLHYVRHRGVFRRLCPSCVLRHHPGAFCSSCFDVLDSPPPSDRPLIHCSRCPALSHLACLPDPEAASQYLCPICSNPDGFSFFPAGSSGEGLAEKSGSSDGEEWPANGSQWTIDLSSAKVFLTAALLASASMSRAVAAARADVDRKVKEAAMARKRAREMLERALSVPKKQIEKMNESIEATEVVESKKKMPRMNGMVDVAMLAQRNVQERQREKWMRFHKPIQMMHRPAIQGIIKSDTDKGPSVNSVDNHVTADAKDRVEREKEVKGLLLSSQSSGFKGEDLTVGAAKGPRIPQSTQDVSAPNSNIRALFTGSPNPSSLHS